MKVSDIGQFGLIDTISKMIQKARDNRAESWRNLITGIGDDCAVWRGSLSNQLAKVDCQVQGIHFDLDIVSWEDLGWKSLAVNLSDIAAMGGIPEYALVSLGLPLDTEVEDVVSLYRGLLKLASQSGTAIVGGNTSGSAVVFVDINVIGKTGNPDGKYLSRLGAEPGDRIAVTGWLGSAAAGYQILSRKLAPGTADVDILKHAFARPEPRLKEGRLLVEKGVKTGMDISDGLLADLGHICQSSAAGAIIEAERLPILPEVISIFGIDASELALAGGEDYQLLFTARPEIMESVQQASEYPITVIGEITAENAGQVILVDAEGKRIRSKKSGWDHFKYRYEKIADNQS